MYRILIVEDDATIAAVIADALKRWQYEVVVADRFDDILGVFKTHRPQLVIMDIGLPVYNGYYWCQQIRAVSKVPILFLSSRDDQMDIVMAVQMGGDDYLDKSFALEVLVAKVRALLRRSYDFVGEDHFLHCDNVLLYPQETRLEYGQAQASLTTTQCNILTLLFQHKGAYVSREALSVQLWEHESYIDDNTLSVNLTRLRKRLAELGVPDLIRTKKGYGYGVGIED